MGILRAHVGSIKSDQRGFTLPELLTTIAIMGILLAIAIIILLGLLERWRVEAAAKQLAADLRRAHASATNQLTDWRVVLVPERAAEDEGPDYYLIRLREAYGPGKPKPTALRTMPRTFPANVEAMIQNSVAGPIEDDRAGTYYLSPDASIPESRPTRTLELNSDGAMTGYGGSPSGTVRVTIDEDPQGQVRYVAATSRIKVLP